MDARRAAVLTAAIRSAQLVMQRAGSPLLADGHWGHYTNGAFNGSSTITQLKVRELLRDAGTSPEDLSAHRATRAVRAAVAASGSVADAISRAAAVSGVPESTINAFARIESNFNPKAANGSSRGLLQVQPAAWAAVRSKHPGIPDYNSGVWDPYWNALTGAYYVKQNVRTMLSLGYTGEITPAVQYLAHQQGAAGFVGLWKLSENLPGGFPPPAQAMRGNPPQDQKGITLDPKQFYSRWLAVATSKMS